MPPMESNIFKYIDQKAVAKIWGQPDAEPVPDGRKC